MKFSGLASRPSPTISQGESAPPKSLRERSFRSYHMSKLEGGNIPERLSELQRLIDHSLLLFIIPDLRVPLINVIE